MFRGVYVSVSLCVRVCVHVSMVYIHACVQESKKDIKFLLFSPLLLP